MAMERDTDTQRLAYRFMFRLFLGICIPFNKVQVSAATIFRRT